MTLLIHNFQTAVIIANKLVLDSPNVMIKGHSILKWYTENQDLVYFSPKKVHLVLVGTFCPRIKCPAGQFILGQIVLLHLILVQSVPRDTQNWGTQSFHTGVNA